MKNFISEANKEFFTAEKLMKQCDTDFKILVAYYGEDPKTAQPDEFFKYFDNFKVVYEVITLNN